MREILLKEGVLLETHLKKATIHALNFETEHGLKRLGRGTLPCSYGVATRGGLSLLFGVFVAVWMCLMPLPSGFDNAANGAVLWRPIQLRFSLGAVSVG